MKTLNLQVPNIPEEEIIETNKRKSGSRKKEKC